MTTSQQPASLFRMASFRLAVLGMLFSLIAAVVVFALVYEATGIAAYEELSPIVAGDRADLFADMQSDGWPIARQIAQEEAAGDHTYYELTDVSGNKLAGTTLTPHDPAHWSEVVRFEDPALPPGVEQVDGIGARLADGNMLFIGEDASVFAELNRRIALLFAVVFGLLIGLGLLASLLIAAYSLKRVRAISEASRDIVAGDLSRRIEAYGIDDELDVLTTDLNRMLETIERLVEKARQVTSDIAHDLRSPLMRLRDRLVRIERLAVAQAQPGIAAELRGALGQAEIVISIFSSLLRIAEIEAGALHGSFVPLDLSTLLSGIAEEFQPVAEDRRQSIELSVISGMWIHGDAPLLTQMLVNLVENAIRYCPEGTVITLSLKKMNDEIAWLDVADDGPGIPAAEQERVFERFVRLDRSQATPGHGLGLPLVRAIAAFHGGNVMVLDNKPGLRVRVKLPWIRMVMLGGQSD
jgi:signal transduction histidine kinase